MAMSGGKDDGQPMMEMNTTPLIDVMLVLLIMLMITIPPVSHAVNIDLPVNDPNAPPPEVPIDPVVNKVIILPDSTVQWNGTPVTLAADGTVSGPDQIDESGTGTPVPARADRAL